MKKDDINMKRIWRSFEIPDYEKKQGRSSPKVFKSQIFEDFPGYQKKAKKK